MMKFNENQSERIPALRRLKTKEGALFLMSPPEIISEKTSVELELLENIGRRLKKEDIESIERYDKNTLNEYYHILEQFFLSCDKNEVEDLIHDVGIIVDNEKNKHGRLRPNQIAKRQGFEIQETISSNDTSSYPSKHATESMFLSLYFADKFPLYKEVFMETANKIANSRLLSSNNYPTDNLAGQTIAYVLFNKYKEDKE